MSRSRGAPSAVAHEAEAPRTRLAPRSAPRPRSLSNTPPRRSERLSNMAFVTPSRPVGHRTRKTPADETSSASAGNIPYETRTIL